MIHTLTMYKENLSSHLGTLPGPRSSSPGTLRLQALLRQPDLGPSQDPHSWIFVNASRHLQISGCVIWAQAQAPQLNYDERLKQKNKFRSASYAPQPRPRSSISVKVSPKMQISQCVMWARAQALNFLLPCR